MKKYFNPKLATFSLFAILGGCASNSDLTVVQSQVERLSGQVSAMQGEITSLQNELGVVKKQRVVRLPTGAPVKTRKRASNNSSFSNSEEQNSYNSALSLYKSGDSQGAITKFNKFITNYPNSKQRNEALHYMASAHYALRDYGNSQVLLEELVYQTPMNQINPRSLKLLEKVYSVTGANKKLSDLKNFVKSTQSL